MLAAVGDDTYKLIQVLHLLTVIIGFGSVFLFGVFGVKAKKRGGRDAQAIAETTYEVATQWSEWFIYAVPITGIVLILISDDVWKFSQAWISLTFLVYIAAIGIVHGAHLPNIRRMNALMAELTAGAPPTGGGPPPQVAELERRGQRAALLGGILNVLVVVAVVLMVYKPGL